MNDEPKQIITDFKTEEQRQERAQNRRASFERLRSIVKFLLIMGIFTYAFIHRTEIQKVCFTGFNRVMKHFTLSPQMRQKSDDYQKQLDGATTN